MRALRVFARLRELRVFAAWFETKKPGIRDCREPRALSTSSRATGSADGAAAIRSSWHSRCQGLSNAIRP